MNWLKKFMVGRYGGDQLSIFLFALSILLTIIGRFTEISVIIMLSYLPLFVGIYRMLSKDVKKRSMENYKFAIKISPIYSKYKRVQNRIKDLKTHKYFKCPNCKTILRVPKGKGKILITCPKCRTKVTKNT